MCRHWIELDDESGRSVEYCRAVHREVTCCGGANGCEFPGKYEGEENGESKRD